MPGGALRVRPEGKSWPPTVPVFLRTSGAAPVGIGIPSRSFASKLGDIVSILDFGGKGDGVFNNHDALRNAFQYFTTSGNAGGTIYFPPGKYIISSAVTCTFPNNLCSVAMVGAGIDATIISFTAGGLTASCATFLNSFHCMDLSFTTNTNGTLTALTLTNPNLVSNPGVVPPSTFYRVVWRGDDGYGATNWWNSCLAVNNVSNVNCDACGFFGSSTTFNLTPSAAGNAVTLVGNSGLSSFSVQHNYNKCFFSYWSNGVQYGSFVQGVTINQCNFTALFNGVSTPASATGGLLQLGITNSQFGNGGAAGTSGVNLSTWVEGLFVDNCLFNVGGNSSFGIAINQDNGSVISNNTFAGTGNSGQVAISINSTTSAIRSVISENLVTGFNGTSAIGINLGNTASSVMVLNNQLFGSTTPISLGTGTGHLIYNNRGYNPVGAAAITVTASPFTYTAGLSPESVYITGGTVSVIAQGGTTMFTASPATIDLDPGQSVTVTYSVAPTMNKFIH